MLTNTAPSDLIASLRALASDQSTDKEGKSAFAAKIKSTSAHVVRLGFTAAALGMVEKVKEGFKETNDKGKLAFTPAWKNIGSDFSHGTLIAEFLRKGGRIAIAGTIGGQAVSQVTKDHIPAMLEGMQTPGDLEVSSLWKKVQKANADRAEADKNRNTEADNMLAGYLSSAQCRAEHNGMTVEQLTRALVTADPGVIAEVQSIGREVVAAETLKAELAEKGQNLAEAVGQAVELITANPELIGPYKNDLLALLELTILPATQAA